LGCQERGKHQRCAQQEDHSSGKFGKTQRAILFFAHGDFDLGMVEECRLQRIMLIGI
jgi:hypothetical protein